jgi:hypothetical protein
MEEYGALVRHRGHAISMEACGVECRVVLDSAWAAARDARQSRQKQCLVFFMSWHPKNTGSSNVS